MSPEERLRHSVGPRFMKAAMRHDVSHGAREVLWIFMLRNSGEVSNALTGNPKGCSYRTIRRDAEETMPRVSMDIIRLGPDGMVEENDVSSIKQKKGLRKHMETASCTV